jgi:cytidylate kinase
MKQVSQIVDQQMRDWDLRRQSNLRSPVEKGPVICISRDIGVGARIIAKRLSEILGAAIVGRDTIDFVAEDLHAQRRLVDSLDEQGQASLERWVDGYLHGSPIEYDEYGKSLVKVFRAAAQRGNVILLGRCASFVLGLEQAFCVRIVAPLERRIKQIISYESCSRQEAEEKIRRADKERDQFSHKVFHRDLNDPLAYHLTLNLHTMDHESAVQIILDCMRLAGVLKEKLAKAVHQ